MSFSARRVADPRLVARCLCSRVANASRSRGRRVAHFGVRPVAPSMQEQGQSLTTTNQEEV